MQIGDENVHIVRCLLDEVFGSENFASLISVKKTGGLGAGELKRVADYIVWYWKDADRKSFRPVYFEKQAGVGQGTGERYDQIEETSGARRPMTALERDGSDTLPVGSRPFKLDNLKSGAFRDNTTVPFVFDGRTYHPGPANCWKTTVDGLQKLGAARRIAVTGASLSYVRFIDDFPVYEATNIWDDTGPASDKTYVVQTATSVIERCILMTTDPGDLVLDPTCGSGTTAYVAEQWGRRWITIDTSRVALALARTRLMAAKYPYYLLADSPEGLKKEAEITGEIPPTYKTENDFRRGFVYKRVPHVTLKSIANNPDIKEGMSREEIDAAIARHAETETLYDKPYEDAKRVRVTGPFTVESLSPHRVLASEQDAPAAELEGRRASDAGQFEAMILDNLRKAGVQNTKKKERLVFDRLDPHPGTWVQATGTYQDAEGKTHRVAVSIGPEHGTVGPQQVRTAAMEAVKGLGHDVLVVCGFAFDPHVSEEARNYGKLTVLPTRMNPDLTMGEELLKKTGAANLFTVFGEPDIEISSDKEGYLTVHLNGVDVYDPTTGAIRSSSTDDIACWFIDTDYDGQSFFVRHAYFTGADEPYDKLKRALRADIDEAAWATLYSTTSRPFAPPESGRIAVKVINHYGDEVLKVYTV